MEPHPNIHSSTLKSVRTKAQTVGSHGALYLSSLKFLSGMVCYKVMLSKHKEKQKYHKLALDEEDGPDREENMEHFNMQQLNDC